MPINRPRTPAESRWPADAYALNDATRRRLQVKAIDVLRARLSFERIAQLAGVTPLAVRGWYNGALARPSRFRTLMELARNVHGLLPIEDIIRTKDQRRVTKATKDEVERRDYLLQIAGMDSPDPRAEALLALIAQLKLSRQDFAAAIGVGIRTVAKYLDPKWNGKISLPVLERILGLPARRGQMGEVRSLPDRTDKALLRLLGRELHQARLSLRGHLKAEIAVTLAKLTEFSERTIYRKVFDNDHPSKAFVEKLEAVAETHGTLKFGAHSSKKGRSAM